MRRLSTSKLLVVGEELSEQERLLIEVVAKLRICSHAQLAALLQCRGDEASPASVARAARRVLARLAELGLLARLERRVGGVRAGSAGFVYYLGPAGQRLLHYWQGRGLTRGRFRPEPGGRYVRHRLAISDLYVRLVLSDQAGELELIAFDSEPDAWRRYLDGFGGQALVKPDAFVRVGVGAYEDRYFVEVDLGSESRTVLARKLRAYLDYFHSGSEQAEHGVFPRVLLLTTSEARKAAIVEVVSRLPAEHWQLFTVALLDQASAVVGGQIAQAANQPGAMR